MNTDWNDLIQRYIAGQTTEEETRQLEMALKTDDALADHYLRHMELDVSLEAIAASAEVTWALFTAPASPERARGFPWIFWRPLKAVAAGSVFGALCTSVVFAYVVPSLEKVTALLQESFESGPAPLATGVPVEPGRWSGDYSEVVGEQQGVKPESGRKMLRFLRADYEGKLNPEQSKNGDIYRLIDIRPYREVFADGGAVVQLSAFFDGCEFPADERYLCSLTLYAMDAETATNGSTRRDISRSETLLGYQKNRMDLDRNPATWQRLTSELRLPSDTDFLMVRICIQYGPRSVSRQTFAGHYVDGVRLTMVRRSLLP